MPRKKLSPIKGDIMKYDIASGTLHTTTHTSQIKPKAVIYCRVSDAKQVEMWHWLDSQQTTCETRCNTQNPIIQVDKVFHEPGVSWATLNRKALNECIAYIKKSNEKSITITHLVITEASRLSRLDDISEAFALEKRITTLGVKIVKVDSPWVDEESDVWQLLKTIQYGVASFERKKITARSFNGKLNRLKSGFRPMPFPPVGYLRERKGTKNYQDIIDPIKGPIIKEGLELFATDVIDTQADLWRFLDKKWLRTNAKKNTRLRKTAPEKMLQLHRLFYYAGYLFYPKRGVESPIEGQHRGMITLDTVHKIIKKLQKVHTVYPNAKRSLQQMTDEFPLKGAIVCGECGRTYTWWTTTRYRMKNWKRVCKKYPYYGCANPNCSERLNVPKDKLEDEFVDYISGCWIPHIVDEIITTLFTDQSKRHTTEKINKQKSKEERMIELERKQKQLEEGIISTSIEPLREKFEKERKELEEKKASMNQFYKNQHLAVDKTKDLLTKVKELFTDPKDLRTQTNAVNRQLLFRVRCWDRLTYSKNNKLQTADNAVENWLLGFFLTDCTVCRYKRDSYKTEVLDCINEIYRFLKSMEEEIDALIKLKKSAWNP